MCRALRVFAVLIGLIAIAPAAWSDARTDAITAAVEAGDKRYAILVGVGDYRQAPPVAFVKENLDQMEAMMTDVFFVKQSNIRRIEDPDRLDLAEIFGFEKGEPGSLAGLDIKEDNAELFVYFVGHGSRDLRASGTSDAASAEGFLLATNSRPSTLRHTAYSYDLLVENLDKVQKQRFPKGRVVVFMESCFSGETADGEPLNPSMAAALLAPSEGWDETADRFDVIAVSAAAADTPAYWDHQRHEGVFTGALVTGLRGEADTRAGNNDGVVSFEELRDWLSTSVPSRTAQLGKGRQTPQVSEHAEGALVRLARLEPSGGGTGDVENLSLEFELRELNLRADQVDARDWPALRTLDQDISDFVNRCDGDGCRVFLPTIIPLREVTEMHLSRCKAASEIAAKWMSAGSFRSVERLDALCVAPVVVAACVAGQDPASRACTCVADPFAPSCTAEAVAASTCPADAEAAAALAAETRSLAPLDDFAAASPDCAAETAATVASAREAVCAAGENDGGPVPAGLEACPFAVALRDRQSAQDACIAAYQEAKTGPAGTLARFLTEHEACPQYVNAVAERDGRINRAIQAAEIARSRAEREAAAATLGELSTTFSATLSDAAVKRLTDLGETLAVPTCSAAYKDAERGGADALARFATERSDCRTEVAAARDRLAGQRCRDEYEKVDTRDPVELYRFAQGHPSCPAETADAERLIENIGRECIYDAQNGLSAQLDVINTALEKLGGCRRITLLSPALDGPYAGAEKTLRNLQRALALAAAQQAADPQPKPGPGYTPPPSYQPPANTPAPSSARSVAIYSGVDFYGSDLTSTGLGASSTMECAQICASNSRCSHFTYNAKANVCFPKYGYGRVEQFRGAHSGIILYPGQSAPVLRDDKGRVATATRTSQVY
ncbi:PAN domain-containing protein [Acuticoccus sediminis]|uniref:PAN domain-containing protein n=1 Tax=Acuticoccus sediminis TaxID=2184697 RepID=UPI001CFCE6FC|nr:PAN domain-containing protein [Acuticoccus sediminis]